MLIPIRPPLAGDLAMVPCSTPLLTSAQRERATAALERLLTTLLPSRRAGVPTDAGSALLPLSGRLPYALIDGLGGEALLLAYTQRDGDDQSARLVAYFEAAFAAALASDSSLSLMHGALGVGWSLTHVSARHGLDWADGLAPLDEAACDWLHEPREWDDALDLFSGVVGVSVYLLERPRTPIVTRSLERALAILCQTARSDMHGTYWFRDGASLVGDKPSRGRVIDLGLPHGVPGIIHCLSKLAVNGIDFSRACRLYAGGVQWLMEMGARHSSAARRGLPVAIGEGTPSTDDPLGWCYGNIGAAVALHDAALRMADRRLAVFARGLATRGIGRVDRAEVRDAALCHGAAGMAHGYSRIWRRTYDERFLWAARAWYDVLLSMEHCDGAGVPSYPSDFRRHGGPVRGLMRGHVGIALTLAAALASDAMDWDRVLLLS